MAQENQPVKPEVIDPECRRKPIPPRYLKEFATQMRFANRNAELLADAEWYASLLDTATRFMADRNLTGILYKPDDAVRQYLGLQAQFAERRNSDGGKFDPVQCWEGIIAVELQSDNWA